MVLQASLEENPDADLIQHLQAGGKRAEVAQKGKDLESLCATLLLAS